MFKRSTITWKMSSKWRRNWSLLSKMITWILSYWRFSNAKGPFNNIFVSAKGAKKLLVFIQGTTKDLRFFCISRWILTSPQSWPVDSALKRFDGAILWGAIYYKQINCFEESNSMWIWTRCNESKQKFCWWNTNKWLWEPVETLKLCGIAFSLPVWHRSGTTSYAGVLSKMLSSWLMGMEQ